jgi:hypothetical protein
LGFNRSDSSKSTMARAKSFLAAHPLPRGVDRGEGGRGKPRLRQQFGAARNLAIPVRTLIAILDIALIEGVAGCGQKHRDDGKPYRPKSHA